MLLNVAAHNVSIQNLKVSKRERHITYRVTKCTASQNVKCTLRNRYKTFCTGINFVTLYIMWRLRFENFTFWKLYVLELLCCVQQRFVTLRYVTFTLCCFTLCSNIHLGVIIWRVHVGHFLFILHPSPFLDSADGETVYVEYQDGLSVRQKMPMAPQPQRNNPFVGLVFKPSIAHAHYTFIKQWDSACPQKGENTGKSHRSKLKVYNWISQ